MSAALRSNASGNFVAGIFFTAISVPRAVGLSEMRRATRNNVPSGFVFASAAGSSIFPVIDPPGRGGRRGRFGRRAAAAAEVEAAAAVGAAAGALGALRQRRHRRRRAGVVLLRARDDRRERGGENQNPGP